MNKCDVVRHFGTQSKIAEMLSISQAAVSKWPDQVPEKQAMKLALLTEGKLAYDPSDYADKSSHECAA